MLRTILLVILICRSPSLGHTVTTDPRTGPKAYLPENVYDSRRIWKGLKLCMNSLFITKVMNR